MLRKRSWAQDPHTFNTDKSEAAAAASSSSSVSTVIFQLLFMPRTVRERIVWAWTFNIFAAVALQTFSSILMTFYSFFFTATTLLYYYDDFFPPPLWLFGGDRLLGANARLITN